MSILPHSSKKMQAPSGKPDRLQVATAAVSYLGRGWPVIPVRDKVPLTKWRLYQHVLPTDAQLMAWLAEEPAPDVAIVTGAYSGLLVLDVDGPEGEKAIRGRHLPPTPTARTPRGGRHILFRHPGGRIRSTVGLLPKVDIRADGGYIVAPPAPGREWMDFLSPEDVDLADVPDWLMDLLTDVSPKRRPAPGTGGLRRAPMSSFFDGPPAGGGTSNDIVTCPIPDREGREREREAVKTRAAAPEALHALKGPALLEWYDQTEVGITVAAHLGLPVEGLAEHGRGKGFRCVLHDDKRPSAGLFVHRNGGVLYKCFHGNGKTYSLPELAVMMARQPDDADRPPRGPELATWALRLLVETGHVAPAAVEAHQLPDDVPASVRRVYEGFLLLLAVKWLHTPGEATTFSWRFAAGWCGVSKSTAERAMRQLMGDGYIRKVGEAKATFGRSMGLFLPGTPKRRPQKGGRPR